jgi:hypothetical protein
MQIVIELPDDIAQHPDPGREAVERLAIDGYRSGQLTHYQASQLNRRGAKYAVIGGFAIRAANYVRATMDIDLLVADDPTTKLNLAVEHLANGFR